MSKRTVHYCLALVSAGLMVMTSGCGVETPFARNIDDVNLKGEQLPARIQLSDAQVFSREALINDRLREVAFLKKLIDEETVRHQFEPQLQRDLTHITTMAAQLGIGFNPGVGLQNEQALDQNERLHDIQMKKLDIELKRLQRELEALDQGGEATALSDTSPTPLTDPPSADTKAVLDQLGNLNAQVADLLKRPFRESKTKASPEHIYRDWQAYRAELRADEQAARLDDIHDSEGKTLYRMQFTATILPGQEKDKFGIALVDVKPPVLNDRQLNRLYYDWLKHVNARLNIVSDKGIVPDLLYQRLGRSTDLFRYVYAAINRRNPDGEVVPATFRIAVHPEVSSFVQLYVCRAYVSTTDPIPPQSIDAPAGIPATSLMERVCKGHWSIIKESLKPRTGTQTASPGKGRIVAFARQTLGKRASKTIDADSDTDIDDEATAKTNACHAANSVEAAILAFNRVDASKDLADLSLI